jgi:hypothetical protein
MVCTVCFATIVIYSHKLFVRLATGLVYYAMPLVREMELFVKLARLEACILAYDATAVSYSPK